MTDSFDARSTLKVGDKEYQIYRLDALKAPTTSGSPIR